MTGRVSCDEFFPLDHDRSHPPRFLHIPLGGGAAPSEGGLSPESTGVDVNALSIATGSRSGELSAVVRSVAAATAAAAAAGGLPVKGAAAPA